MNNTVALRICAAQKSLDLRPSVLAAPSQITLAVSGMTGAADLILADAETGAELWRAALPSEDGETLVTLASDALTRRMRRLPVDGMLRIAVQVGNGADLVAAGLATLMRNLSGDVPSPGTRPDTRYLTALDYRTIIDEIDAETRQRNAADGRLTAALEKKADRFAIDDAPEMDSAHPISSGGVYEELKKYPTRSGVEGTPDLWQFNDSGLYLYCLFGLHVIQGKNTELYIPQRNGTVAIAEEVAEKARTKADIADLEELRTSLGLRVDILDDGAVALQRRLSALEAADTVAHIPVSRDALERLKAFDPDNASLGDLFDVVGDLVFIARHISVSAGTAAPSKE